MRTTLSFGFRIVELLDNNRALVSVIQKQEGEMNKSGKLEVLLSKLVQYKIANGAIELGKYYESTDDSMEYSENPFQLIKYAKDEHTIDYIFALVYEKSRERHVEELPMGGSRVYYTYSYHKKADFRRWRNRVPRSFTSKQEASKQTA